MEKTIKNVTAERIVIGILLNHPDWLVQLNSIVRTEYFFLTGHKIVFYIMYSLIKEGIENIDSMAILAKAETIARATDTINENGGFVYLENLKELAEYYSQDDLRRYAAEVTTCSFKRDQIKVNEEIIQMLDEKPNMGIGEIDIFIQQKQQELVHRYSAGNQLKSIGDVFDDVWREIESERAGNGIIGLPSKISKVNSFFTYQNSELIVIGARAKYGKSNWAINETHYLAVLNNVPVGYFDTEMKTKIFLSRLIALDSGVPISEIRNGQYLNDIDKVMAVEASKERVKKAPIFHNYDYSWDKSKVQHRAKILKLKNNIGLLIYDYIKVKEVSGAIKEHSELGNWTIFLKDLAGELDIPILTFGQLAPKEHRLADSDKINRYASVIAYLLPKSTEQIQTAFGAEYGGTDYLYVDYNRIGANMSDPEKGINLLYNRSISKFEQAPYQILDDEYV